MLKATVLIAIIILAPTLVLLASAYSTLSGWSIAIQTNESYYHVGDEVFISGNVTYNDWPTQSVQVGISVKSSSSGTTYFFGSATTDKFGAYNSSFTLGTGAELGTYTVSASAEGYTNQTTFLLTDTIYIKANGGTEPENASISRNGDVYTMMDDVAANSSIGLVIERNNTLLEGAGFTLHGKNLVGSSGIYLANVSNVTMRNLSANSFQDGIHERGCSNCNIEETSLSFNVNGIYCSRSNFSIIEGNNITKSTYTGIWLDTAQRNHISKNRLEDNVLSDHSGSIDLQEFSSYNSIVGNNFINNTWYGIYIQNSYSNQILHNNFNDTHQAFEDGNSSGNVWNNGYPFGGNYWNDYSGPDEKHGPSQDQLGSDGIGDAQYTVDPDSVDYYPLISPFPIDSVPARPVASFNVSPDSPIAEQEAVFNASDSQCVSGKITDYCWSFGDGTYSGGEVSIHKYESYGNYNVTLMAISDTRLSNNQSLWVTVRESPFASFTLSPIDSLVGQPTTFDASTSKAQGGAITMFIWNFGDGNLTLTADPVVSHTYTFPWTFNVTLTVLDSEDLNSSFSQLAPVTMPTSVSISTSPSSAHSGFKVDINGTLFDFYGKGLTDELLVLSYNSQGSTAWFPISSGVTDSLGHYDVQWIPSSAGYFTIKAEWAGNATHRGASNYATLSILPYQNQYIFSVESNSTVSALTFNVAGSDLSFNVTGPPGTTGYVKVTAAKSLLEDATSTKVYLDGNQFAYSSVPTDDSWIFAFTYSHSTHKVTMILQVDSTPPVTISDYEDLWHNTDFTIDLSATDQKSGVAETYRINGGPTEKVSINGQPLITVENANNTLEYWSIDKAGNEEFPHETLIGIELDKTSPAGSILINGNATYGKSTSAFLTISANEDISGLSKMRFSNDNLMWTAWETYNVSKAWTLASGDGTKTVYCQFTDKAELASNVYTDSIILDMTSPIIEELSRTPKEDAQPNRSVTISVNASDPLSGIETVSLMYNRGVLWIEEPMTFNSSVRLYEFSIKGEGAGTLVKYKITAQDRAGNIATNDNAGQYYVYTVIPEFPSPIFPALPMVATLLAFMIHRRKRARHTSQHSMT